MQLQSSLESSCNIGVDSVTVFAVATSDSTRLIGLFFYIDPVNKQ
jgi:hypothetical protein